MQYMLLIYTDPAIDTSMTDSEQSELMGKYFTFTSELRESGAMVDGAPLQSVTTATSVRIRDGETMITDGPFAETKETLGGFYLIDVDNLDEALKWAAKIPSVHQGCIEVRPVQVFNS